MQASHAARPTERGFTLLELLITIAVIAILATVLIFILNPAETLQKARDSQRISDLSTMKTALGLYLTATSTPRLDNTSGNTTCVGGSGADTLYLSTTEAVTDATAPSGFTFAQASTTVLTHNGVSADGWIPVAFSGLTGGSPIGNLPDDPTNTVVSGTSTAAAINSSALIYRYACKASPITFEMDARLESATYTTDDNRAAKDGGNNANLFEAGTDMTILPGTLDF